MNQLKLFITVGIIVSAALVINVPIISAKVYERKVKSQTVIAIASDLHDDTNQPLWPNVLNIKPNIFLFLGDNVPLDTLDESVMKYEYAKLATVDGFKRLLASEIPIVATWDDHDYGADDAGAEYKQKEVSRKLFLDFFREPSTSNRRKHSGVYDSKIFGVNGRRVQIIALDLRYFRSQLVKSLNKSGYIPNTDVNATMLGADQWTWLKNGLKKPAEVRIIMSSIQVISKDNGWENWMNFPLERAKLFKTIKDTGANGVLFVSGDRHFADLSIMNGGIGYPIYDFTSGPFTNVNNSTLEKNKYRLKQQYLGMNFGLITIDWAAYGKGTWIKIEARNIDNRSVLHEELPLSILQQGVLPYSR